MLEFISQYGYRALYPAVVVEGPIVSFLAGYFSSTGVLNIYIAFLIVLLADVTSDILHRALGYYGGRKLVEKYGPKLGFDAEKAEKLATKIHANKIKTIFGKVIYGIGGVPVVACGLAKIPIYEFLIISFWVSCIQAAGYMALGWFFGQFYNQVLQYMSYGGYIFGGITVVLLGIYIYLNKKKD